MMISASLTARMMAVAVLAGALGLAACAPTTQAQLDFQEFSEAADRGTLAGKTCTDALRANPSYAGFLQRYPLLDVDTMPLQALMSDAYATPDEGQTLLALHAEQARCDELRYAAWQASDPRSVALFRAGDAVEGDIYADIIQRRTTWGNGLRRLRANYANVIARVRANEAQMTEAMDQQHQAEGERRRQMWGAMNQQFQNQQLINSMNRPRSTNCNSFGGYTNCTSF